MFAIIEHLKESYGEPANELEKGLLKVRSQVDRKMQIVDFATARKPLADRSNRPSTAPAAAKPPAAAAAAQMEAFAPTPAAPAPAAAPAPEAEAAVPNRTPPRQPAQPRALLADAAALELVAAFGAGRDHLSMSGCGSVEPRGGPGAWPRRLGPAALAPAPWA